MVKIYANAHGNYIVETPHKDFYDEASETRMMDNLKRLSAWNGVSEYLDNGDLKWEVTPSNIIEFTNLTLQLI